MGAAPIFNTKLGSFCQIDKLLDWIKKTKYINELFLLLAKYIVKGDDTQVSHCSQIYPMGKAALSD